MENRESISTPFASRSDPIVIIQKNATEDLQNQSSKVRTSSLPLNLKELPAFQLTSAEHSPESNEESPTLSNRKISTSKQKKEKNKLSPKEYSKNPRSDEFSPQQDSSMSSDSSLSLSPRLNGSLKFYSRKNSASSTASDKGDLKRKSYQSRGSNPDIREQKTIPRKLSQTSEFVKKEPNNTNSEMLQNSGAEACENHLFSLDGWTYKLMHLCSKYTIEDRIKKLFSRVVEKHALPSLFFYQDKMAADNTRALNVIQSVQNELISATPIYDRLNVWQKFLKGYLTSQQTNTLLKVLEIAFKKLSDLAVPKAVFQSEASDHKKLPNSGLSNFIDCIKEKKYFPNGEKLDEKTQKKVKAIVLSFFGDSKKMQKEVIGILEEWTKTGQKIKELIDDVHAATFDYMAENIYLVEHLWNEPLEHFIKDIPLTIDNISTTDLIMYYIRDKQTLSIPITINGEKPFEGYKEGMKSTPKEFLFQFLSGLYDAHGFNKDKLNQEVDQLLQTGEKKKNASSEMLRCLRLLKMGCIESSFRINVLLKHRLDDLPKGFIMNNENVSLNFHIEKDYPEKTHVEQIRDYQITKDDIDNTKCCTIPISWKVFYPRDDIWNCVMKLQKYEMHENIKVLQRYLINLASDDSIEKKLNGIKIGHRFVEK